VLFSKNRAAGASFLEVWAVELADVYGLGVFGVVI